MRILNALLGVTMTFFASAAAYDFIEDQTDGPDKPAMGCFIDHLQEAVQMNRERRPLYAEITGGRSTPISLRWFALEIGGQVPAAYWDIMARKYQKQGIPILCNDFVSVYDSPEFQSQYATDAPKLENYQEFSVEYLKNELDDAFLNENFHELADKARQWIHWFNYEPRFNCLTRHVLESIERIALNAPIYQEMAAQKFMTSPAFISRGVINLHFKVLGQAAKIDSEASLIQAQGIPFVCNDVPHINNDDLRSSLAKNHQLPGL